ncbi:MAG: cysteine desulfurase [Deltaproteobacteria bacterium]|nr:cysteine desulfurase [Deltaproteobacteria bacterium]
MMLYLDHNATTPMAAEVKLAMEPFWCSDFGNASSVHRFGQRARQAIDLAREQLASLIAAPAEQIVFTSGGTEADNLALRGVFERGLADRLLISAVEHPAVAATAEALRQAGREVVVAPVDADGRVVLERLAELVDRRTLVSVMWANNDVGTIQPLEQIVALAHERGALVHSDAVQAVGKLAVDVNVVPVDLLSVSAHKLNGPKGVGALYYRRGLSLAPQLRGGAQERRLRAGTENVTAIVGFGAAAALAKSKLLAGEPAHWLNLRESLAAALEQRVGECWVNGAGASRLPNTLSIGFSGVEGAALLMNLDLKGIAVSVGSACSSGTAEPSRVLLAMGQSPRQAAAAVRISFGLGNTPEQLAEIVEAIAESIERLRSIEGAK